MRESLSMDSGLGRGRNFAAALLGAATMAWFATAAAQDTARGTLAAAVRSSGQPCQRVLESEQTGGGSGGASVYRVRCNSGWFQVTMKDGVASEVVSLE